MNIFVVLALAMLLIIVALRKKVPIGPAILAGGLLIWVAVKPEIPLLGEANVHHAAHIRPALCSLFRGVP